MFPCAQTLFTYAPLGQFPRVQSDRCTQLCAMWGSISLVSV